MKNKLGLILHAGLCAFVIYFCVYAFRKPFTAATYEGLEVFGISFKVVLIIAQVFGYALSKYIGIKFISGSGYNKRAFYIIAFCLLAELALLGFAVVPNNLKILFLFLNGIPLGMMWGLVFSYIEGRSITELLAAMLSASYIISSGVTKSVGKYLMTEYEVSEFWMPFMTGAIFFVPLLLAVWLIEKVPPPTSSDIQARNKREAMNDEDRSVMFRSLAPGLIALIVLLFVMTAFRNLRDSFIAELWINLGQGDSSALLYQTELWITAGILALLSAFIYIKDNQKALLTMQGFMIAGLFVMVGATVVYQFGDWLSPFWWMTLSGLGLFMAYVPLGSMVFERISALFKFKSNAGYLIYVADAVSYMGTVIILVAKEVFYPSMSIYNYFIQMIYVCGIVGIASTAFAYFYFKKKGNELSTADY